MPAGGARKQDDTNPNGGAALGGRSALGTRFALKKLRIMADDDKARRRRAWNRRRIARPRFLRSGSVVAKRYRIDRPIGRGEFAVVYQATCLPTGQKVALKVLKSNYQCHETIWKRFRLEAKLLRKLSHPNIVRLLDYGRSAEAPCFIVLELLRGHSLKDVLRLQERLAVERAAVITLDVLAALAAAHAHGIVHRDIKPGNIFLCGSQPDRDSVAKVLDFGVSKDLTLNTRERGPLTHPGEMLGTPFYMAPEQARSEPVTPRTDLFALGLVMAEMLTGEQVCQDRSAIQALFTLASEGGLTLPKAIHGSVLGPIITRATAKPVSQRYRSAEQMRAVLAFALAVNARTANRSVYPELLEAQA